MLGEMAIVGEFLGDGGARQPSSLNSVNRKNNSQPPLYTALPSPVPQYGQTYSRVFKPGKAFGIFF